MSANNDSKIPASQLHKLMRKHHRKPSSSFITWFPFSRDGSNSTYHIQHALTNVKKKILKFLCLERFYTVNKKGSKVVQETTKTLYTDSETTVVRHNQFLVRSKCLMLLITDMLDAEVVNQCSNKLL